MKIAKTALLFCASVCIAAGSTVNAVSWVDTTQTEIASVTSASASDANMGPMLISVTFGDGTTTTCNWVLAGGCNGTGFSISITAGNTYSATWTLTNTHANVTPDTNENITKFSINSVIGAVGMDMYLCSGNVKATQNTTTCNGGGDNLIGTTNSNIGWTAGTVVAGDSIGTTSVVYSNRLYTSGQNIGDEYGMVTFNFSTTAFTRLSGSNTFSWRMDTDLVNLLPSGVPEPATLGLVGLALVGLGALKVRRGRKA